MMEVNADLQINHSTFMADTDDCRATELQRTCKEDGVDEE